MTLHFEGLKIFLKSPNFALAMVPQLSSHTFIAWIDSTSKDLVNKFLMHNFPATTLDIAGCSANGEHLVKSSCL